MHGGVSQGPESDGPAPPAGPAGKVTLQRNLGIDPYGRELVRVFIDGRDAGEILIGEGLAQRFNLRPPKPNWC